MNGYWKYLLRRFIYMALTLFVIITATFLLLQFLPGTPFANQDLLTAKQLELLNQKYGLNQPIFKQYITYLSNVARGDFGVSFQFNNLPVTQIIADRAGPSMQLGLQAMVLGTIVGMLLGVIAAVKQNTWIDTFTSVFAIGGRSVPNFVFAVVLQFIFAVWLNVLPIAFWRNGFASTVLPTVALSISPMAEAARFIRTEMIEVLNSDYIELARAKGFSKFYIIFKHALRNALIPLLTILGPVTASLMTGSLVIEQIFSIPGIGEQFTKSILVNDYPTIMGITIMYSTLLVVMILIVDILYGVVDPRLRMGQGGK
ncbi:ABC transporter permease [Aerococcaceae bacterium zg-ZJ1578]|uniref:oligopeptide ABC transporter permease n=1 Tax=Aerococcaceae TaxID=186827 RepID=UPI0013BE27D7|nr:MULTISPECIES: oligopeptide ABC transporter permease [unclassified Facklamia]MBK0348315.1 ABC transporter permease [Aerococcaceae bacterium zg-1578]MBR7926934.1 ABC transporter permease [Aerococcaceae bacterium zg-ZUI334]MBS4462515.1 ABC transporter permease [Aerococcaceae bacterium zg-B36]QQD65037.1 ABC transporter permease [Aerococcaceae bacterium zg-252]NEW64701.1 ABC transporter permease subunit [Facklamia sp. 252]